jgi:hypothetical protein
MLLPPSRARGYHSRIRRVRPKPEGEGRSQSLDRRKASIGSPKQPSWLRPHRSAGSRPKCIGCGGRCCCPCMSTPRRRTAITARSRLRFMPDCARSRTPGLNGVVRSCSRIHRCIPSLSGAGRVSAAPTYRPSSGLPTWRVRWRRSTSMRGRMPFCSARCSICRCRQTEYRICRLRN